jgi:DNA-binding MarR family transcriptional regulator
MTEVRDTIISTIARYSDREGFSECQGIELMDATGLSKEAVGGYVSAMVKEGLVEVEDWEANFKRQKFIHLTAAGWSAYDALQSGPPQPEYAVFVGGEPLDMRFATYEAAEVTAEDVRGDFADVEVDIDVSPEYVSANMAYYERMKG